MLKKPYYVIEFNASAVMFEIKINDVPLLILNVEGQASTMVPMNHLILESGIQELSINVIPVIGNTNFIKNSSYRSVIKLFDVSNGFKFEKDILFYKMTDIKEGELMPAFSYQDVFYAEVPYNLVAWKYSEDLSEIDDLRTMLDEQYIKLENIISNRQYNTLKSLIQEREDNIEKSMYLDKEERNSRFDELIEDFENGFTIIPHTAKDKLIIFGNNKLVSLIKEDGNSALMLNNEETEEELNIEVKFHIKSNCLELSII